MKLDSYWTRHRAGLPAAAAGPCRAQVDVAVVGGGFTGLSAALALAQARRAASRCWRPADAWRPRLRAATAGSQQRARASTIAEVAAKVGVERARAWYHAYDAAVDAVERLVRDEAIDCDFAAPRQAQARDRPAHLEALKRSAERLVATASTPTSRS